MQEKIANLGIKIFYDSAITKKKKSGELSKPQCVLRTRDSTDGTGQGSDDRENGPEAYPFTPHPQQPKREGAGPPEDRTFPGDTLTEPAPSLPPRRPASSDSSRLLLAKATAPHLRWPSSPGPWQPACSHCCVWGPQGSPQPPAHPPQPPCGIGVHSELGVHRAKVGAGDRERAVPLLPARGLLPQRGGGAGSHGVPPGLRSFCQPGCPTSLPAPLPSGFLVRGSLHTRSGPPQPPQRDGQPPRPGSATGIFLPSRGRGSWARPPRGAQGLDTLSLPVGWR